MKITEREISKAVKTALIDYLVASREQLRPKLVCNNYDKGSNVLAIIEKELSECEAFWFSVAFITKSGLVCFKETLIDLERKGIKGKILTTDYLQFNDPDALRELLSFSNVEVKVYTRESFHTKGYMFITDDRYTFLVGSSNLTQQALKLNKEWNMRITSLENGELVKETVSEFEEMWDNANILTMDWIDKYEKEYRKSVRVQKAALEVNIEEKKLVPNSMQNEACLSLERIRNEGKNKALIISATGTGKTYLSAFDVKKYNPRRMLFLVHRENILTKAKESFIKVLGSKVRMGILSGNKRELDSDYLFSTTSMMSRDEIQTVFSKDHFDYIIIDETHRAGASSYLKIIDYFEPKFLLGMTATPERTDGYDIYSLYDHNIAYEIRLNEAMKEDLLCPFHYFGISELMVDGVEIDETSDFRYLVSNKRVEHIIDKLRVYGHCGTRVKGLIFCSKVEEAKELSDMFNERGFSTLALSGSNSEQQRSEAIERLEQEEIENSLDYIFTVDIFNEGVDIPSVNQVVMLRPTESSIIFIQQLGRGLRKDKGKEYVVILDFIANYKNNYLVPIALADDRSLNKDTIRKFVSEGNRILPGCSTISFDEITRKRIYEAIDNARLNEVRVFKEAYYSLKYKIGRIPSVSDFESFGSIDVCKYFDKFGSYYDFLVKYDEEYTSRFSKAEEESIRYVSQKLAKGKRLHELMLLKILKSKNNNARSEFVTEMEKYGILIRDLELESTVKNLTNEFTKSSEKGKFTSAVYLDKEVDNLFLSEIFESQLENKTFDEVINELIEFGISRYKSLYSNRYNASSFQLYQKYTYEDVCRLLNWDANIVALNIGGYFYDKKTKTLPVFINYVKEDGSIAYDDRFLSPKTLIALSKHPRSINSEDARRIYNAKEEGIKIFLFVRKVKDDNEAKEFYFLGEVEAIGEPEPITMPVTKDDAFEITYRLETEVREDIFEYLTT